MTEVRNPYAAPDAAVADVAAPGAVGPRPAEVRRACKAMWWSFVITLVITPISQLNSPAPTGLGFGAGMVMVIAVIVITGLFTWWFTAKLSAGRNWMRWLVNILVGISLLALPLTYLGFREAFQTSFVNTLDIVASIVQFALSVYVLVLINSAPAREWFLAMKRSRA
jgi:hypothetical protein